MSAPTVSLGVPCESCTMAPAVRVVVFDDTAFLVCRGCAPGTAAHGTRAGYNRHRVAGERPCTACRVAQSVHDATRHQRRRAAAAV